MSRSGTGKEEEKDVRDVIIDMLPTEGLYIEVKVGEGT